MSHRGTGELALADTVAFVPGTALSGAAIVALGCDQIIMAPNADVRKRIADGLELNHSADINLLGKVALASALSPEGANS